MWQPLEKSRVVEGDDKNRTWSLVQMDKFSEGRQALEAAVETWDSTNVGHVAGHVATPTTTESSRSWSYCTISPDNLLDLDQFKFMECIHSARRSAAAEPSGMTAEHFKPMLESGVDIQFSISTMSRLPVVRCTRMTALQKDDGGVMSTSRRVARTIATQFSKRGEPQFRSSSPFPPGLVASA